MKRVMFYMLLMTLISCGSQSELSFRNINKGHKKTEDLIKRLTLEEHRVFFFYSTYALDSYVWTHNNDLMTLYIINNADVKNLKIKNNNKKDVKIENFDSSDPLYPYALDGDIIGVSELNDLNKINTIKIPINGMLFIETEFPENYNLAHQLQLDLLMISDFLGKEIY